MHVVDLDRRIDGCAKVISLPVGESCFDAAPGEPPDEVVAVVITSGVGIQYARAKDVRPNPLPRERSRERADAPPDSNTVEQPSAALVADLKQRGLLQDTLVMHHPVCHFMLADFGRNLRIVRKFVPCFGKPADNIGHRAPIVHIDAVGIARAPSANDSVTI